MSKRLDISPDLRLPIENKEGKEFVTQTNAILAVRGAGKTNLARVMAEEMFTAGIPFVVIDPVGSWYGLRSSRNGKGPGIPVPIFGGEHGDVPLEKTGGALIASLVAEQRLSCVVDVSLLSEGSKVQFLLDFATKLYQSNRHPLHVFLEEADEVVPQKPFREQARLLRAFENIVRRGRSRGLGITMITQRSAVISKSVLTQIENLFVMRTTSPQDRKAIEAWVEYHASPKELLSSLQGLQDGEAWLWSPSWLGITKRFKARMCATFDSGATPKDSPSGLRAPTSLADVDLGSIRKAMEATIERAKDQDPSELKHRISELQRQLAARPVQQKAEVKEIRLLTKADEAVFDGCRTRLATVAAAVESLNDNVNSVRTAFLSALASVRQTSIAVPVRSSGNWQKDTTTVRLHTTSKPRVTDQEAKKPGKMDRIVLAVLAQHGPSTIERIALLAGYRISGGFRNVLSNLRTSGLIDGQNTGTMEITALGVESAPASVMPVPGPELVSFWMNHKALGKMDRAILESLTTAYPAKMSIDEISTITGYAVSGGFRNVLSKLRTTGLIEGKNTGSMSAHRSLMERQ